MDYILYKCKAMIRVRYRIMLLMVFAWNFFSFCKNKEQPICSTPQADSVFLPTDMNLSFLNYDSSILNEIPSNYIEILCKDTIYLDEKYKIRTSVLTVAGVGVSLKSFDRSWQLDDESIKPKSIRDIIKIGHSVFCLDTTFQSTAIASNKEDLNLTINSAYYYTIGMSKFLIICPEQLHHRLALDISQYRFVFDITDTNNIYAYGIDYSPLISIKTFGAYSHPDRLSFFKLHYSEAANDTLVLYEITNHRIKRVPDEYIVLNRIPGSWFQGTSAYHVDYKASKWYCEFRSVAISP